MQHRTTHGNRRMLLMILFCLIPVAVMGAIFVLRIPVPQVLTYGLILLCPLSHVLMLGLIGRQRHDQAFAAARGPSAEPSAVKATGIGGAVCH